MTLTKGCGVGNEVYLRNVLKAWHRKGGAVGTLRARK